MTGFRAFESFSVGSLCRVNLIVGKNNSGKTSVLEAVDMLASDGSAATIHDSAQRRGEMRLTEWHPRLHTVPSIAHLFHGHICEPGARFELRRSHGVSVAVELRSLDSFNSETLSDTFGERLPPEAIPAMGLVISASAGEGPDVIFPVTEDGLLLHPLNRRWTLRPSARFLSVTSLDPTFLGQAWNTIITEGREQEVVDDMKLLMPNIDSIHFLTNDGMPRSGIVVGLHGDRARYPLGTFGDGMRRLLLLRLALSSNAGGFVLVDEVDTGLHWTVMAGMWHLIAEAARKSQIQIFATTHSYDCIRGLAAMVKSYPELAEEVSIQKIDTSLPRAVNIQGIDIPDALECGIDLR